MCTTPGSQHFCCRGCVIQASGRHGSPRRCRKHRFAAVVACGPLWHASSAADLVCCPLGCWVDPGSLEAHACPRVERGPVAIPGAPSQFPSLSAARRWALETRQSHGVYFVGGKTAAVRVVTRKGHGAPPVAVSVVLACTTEAHWVEVTWADSSGRCGGSVSQHALVTPCARAGDVVDLLPRTSYNPAAEPYNCRLVRVRSVASCAYIGPGPSRWSSLWGSSWAVWKAAVGSPCAARRFPFLPQPPAPAPPPPPPHGQTRELRSVLKGPFPGAPPAYTPCAGGDRVRCARCGASHASVARFAAVCAPDAVIV